VSAGSDFSARVLLPERPAPLWTVTAFLRGVISIDILSIPDGAAHMLEADASETTTWLPGRYWYELRATDGSDTLTVARGELTVRHDMALQGAGYDGRSHARRVLDAIEAVIEGRATKDQQSYTINNRQLALTPIKDLLMLRDRYRAELRQKRGKGYGRRIKVVM
jgi:hypothetical protein